MIYGVVKATSQFERNIPGTFTGGPGSTVKGRDLGGKPKWRDEMRKLNDNINHVRVKTSPTLYAVCMKVRGVSATPAVVSR